MLSQQDLQQLAGKGISEEQINQQLDAFKTGFPFLNKVRFLFSLGGMIMLMGFILIRPI